MTYGDLYFTNGDWFNNSKVKVFNANVNDDFVIEEDAAILLLRYRMITVERFHGLNVYLNLAV